MGTPVNAAVVAANAVWMCRRRQQEQTILESRLTHGYTATRASAARMSPQRCVTYERRVEVVVADVQVVPKRRVDAISKGPREALR